MTNRLYLQRFLVAQDGVYDRALEEIKTGRKQSHWMWYIFPQLKGLGHSHNSSFYAIQNQKQAEEYLNHKLLGGRLIEISQALLELPTSDPSTILGSPDDMKLKSSMTLFSSLPNTDSVFAQVLEKFYEGKKDQRTLDRL